jgi:hypothetical protein
MLNNSQNWNNNSCPACNVGSNNNAQNSSTQNYIPKTKESYEKPINQLDVMQGTFNQAYNRQGAYFNNQQNHSAPQNAQNNQQQPLQNQQPQNNNQSNNQNSSLGGLGPIMNLLGGGKTPDLTKLLGNLGSAGNMDMGSLLSTISGIGSSGGVNSMGAGTPNIGSLLSGLGGGSSGLGGLGNLLGGGMPGMGVHKNSKIKPKRNSLRPNNLGNIKDLHRT